MTDVAILGRVLRNQIVPAQPTIGGGSGGGGGGGSTPSGPASVEFVIDGGGSVVITGVAGSLVMPFDCTLTSVELLADQSGSIEVDIWKSNYSGYPPSGGASITASDKPTITTALKSQDTALTGWTTSVAAGDILVFNVDSVTSIKRCSVVLTFTRPSEVSALEYVIDGGGIVPATGVAGSMVVPFNCVINKVELLADQSGSIEIDIWKSDYTGYEPTISGSITASDIPTITTAIKSQDTALTGWTITLNAGDILVYNVDSVTTITRCSVVLLVTRLIGAIGVRPTSINFLINGNGSIIGPGTIGSLIVPYDCTINSCTLLADTSSSTVLDIKKTDYSTYPSATSIVASAPPTLSTAQKSQDTTLTGWTTSITAGDILEFSVTSNTLAQELTVVLLVTKR